MQLSRTTSANASSDCCWAAVALAVELASSLDIRGKFLIIRSLALTPDQGERLSLWRPTQSHVFKTLVKV